MTALVERRQREMKAREVLIESLFKSSQEHGVQTIRKYIELETSCLKDALVKCDGNSIYVTQGKIQALMELEDHILGLSRPRRG